VHPAAALAGDVEDAPAQATARVRAEEHPTTVLLDHVVSGARSGDSAHLERLHPSAAGDA
jgi:hypothetical protein